MSDKLFGDIPLEKYPYGNYDRETDYGIEEQLENPRPVPEFYDFSNLSTPGKTTKFSRFLMGSEFGFQLREENTEQYQALEAAIENGQPFEMDNGYTFVIDRRPEGHEFDYISAQEYTQYFADRQIPITATGYLHTHDLNHARDYLKLFKAPLFADLVAGAAQNALPEEESCKQFTNAMDKFGDAVFLMTRFRYDDYIGFDPYQDVAMAKHNLRNLISLYTGEPVNLFPELQPEGTPRRSEELFTEVWTQLGLERYGARMPRRHLPLSRIMNQPSAERIGGFDQSYKPRTNYVPEELPAFELGERFLEKYQ